MARPRNDDQERRVAILCSEQNVTALAGLLLEPETRAAAAAAAVDGLAAIGTQEAWDALGEAAALAEGPLAELIPERLAATHAPGAVRALGEALRNPSVFARGAAVRALAGVETACAMASLLRGARDPEPGIARMARRFLLRQVEQRPHILGEIRESTAEGIFELLDDRGTMELLSDAYPESVRLMAARRLGALGGEDVTHVLASLVESAQGAVAEACWKALESCAGIQEHILLPLLAGRDPAKRARALAVYARFVGPDGEALLTGLARDAHPAVRKAALPGLVRLLREQAIPHLVTALRDADVEVRLMAVDLLVSIEDSSPELVDVVDGHQGELRRRALICLANRGIVTPGLVMPYVEFLLKGAGCTDLAQQDYLDGLGAAARALGQSQLPEALLALTSLARSVIRRMRRIAIEAIMLFEPGERAEALFSLVDTYDHDVLKNVAFGLLEAKDPRAVVPLIRAALECKGRPAYLAKAKLLQLPEVDDLDFLVRELKARWPTVRRFSAERLKLLKDRRAVPALLDASRDEDVEVQLAVLEALSPFAADEEPVTKRMLEVLGLGDVSVRQAACEALGEARCKAAVPDLIRAISNFFLRPRASEALKRIGDRKGYLAIKRLERRERLFSRKPVEKRALKQKKVLQD